MLAERDVGTRNPALDGLRGVACLLVLGFHSGLVPGGAIGVDVFFVLSGYLITRLLLKEREQDGRISLGRFYFRRALRLLPALGVLLAVALLASLFVEPHLLLGPFGRAATGWVLLLSANWADVLSGRSLSVLQPTWSLAVEEQFYLLWAPLFASCAAWLSRRTFSSVVWSLALASLCFRVWLWLPSAGEFSESRAFYRQYVTPDARAYALLFGAAWAIGHEGRWREWLRQRARWIGAAALVTLASVACVYDYHHETGIGLLAPGCALLLIDAAKQPATALARLLALRPLAWLGRVSYSVYLWHVAAFAMVAPQSAGNPFQHPPSLLQLGAMLGLALGLGVISYTLVELPALAFRARWEQRLAGTPRAVGAE